MLTFDYASPEQMRGEPVSTSSDVYSLGVVLFELLADVKPYECAAGGLSEAVRLVCEHVPRPPSHVAPMARRAVLAGDLDGIARKALEKAPSDRYAIVADLAADVTAHLDHRPVRARRESWSSLARKFARRHRAGMIFAAGALVLLVAGVVAVSWQARVAERERARAQARFEEVRELANYVIYDLQEGIATLAGSTELRRQMVERSLTYLDSLAADAAGDFELQKEIAGAYVRLGDVLGRENVPNLGDRPGAMASYRKAEEMLRQVLSRNPSDVDARRRLGRLLLTLASAARTQETEIAAALEEESMAIWEALVRESPTNEEDLRGLASAHFSTYIQMGGQTADASLPHMERALELFQKLLEARPSDPDRLRNVALCHKYLSGYYLHRSPPRAHEHSLEAARLDSARLASAPNDAQAKLDYTFDLGTLGDHHLVKQEYDEALEYYEQALALRRELWASDRANVYSRTTLAYMLARVGQTRARARRHRLATPVLLESVEHATAIPQQSAFVSAVLARAYLVLGDVELASGRDPCSSYARMADFLPRFEVDIYFDDVEIQGRDRALTHLKSCGD